MTNSPRVSLTMSVAFRIATDGRRKSGDTLYYSKKFAAQRTTPETPYFLYLQHLHRSYHIDPWIVVLVKKAVNLAS